MFHIGSPEYYRALSSDFERFETFLLEGVRWRGLRGPVYDLVAGNLGLVTQRQSLVLPSHAKRLPLDMEQEEFRREVQRMPFRWRLLLRFLRPLLWAVTCTAGGRHLLWDSLSPNDGSPGRRDSDRSLDQLLLTKRDRVMANKLEAFVESAAAGQGDVAVVAGAVHMPALYSTLRACGYRKGNVRWFKVLEGLSVPSAESDGRAFAKQDERA